MKDKHWLWLLVAGVSLFGLFIVLSIVTVDTETSQRVFVIFSEIIGLATLALAIWGWVYRSSEKWLYLATIVFLSGWLMLGIAYEIGLDSSTEYGLVWFIIYYAVAIISIVVLKISIGKTETRKTLFPVTLSFVQGIQLAYIIVIHIIWTLPF
ncbi:hypothetical protein U0355_11435 [Salimicrobium sp. PL1-032A]|uniref:hypothetical protein n=1 Tax=Salimicrobium sp. PL1-032A TaxID=3095364 RepID=UPI003260EAE2